RATSNRTIWIVAAAFLAVALFAVAAGFVVVRRNESAKSPVSTEWTQLTDFPDSVAWPAISPDGRMLAFVRGAGDFIVTGPIYAKLLPNGEPVQLTHDDDIMKVDVKFAPDGSRIAYSVVEPWDTWTVPILGGQPSLLLPNASGLSWTDQHHFMFSE